MTQNSNNQSAPKSKNKTLFIVLIGAALLCGSICLCGVFSAILVPAFLKTSRGSERNVPQFKISEHNATMLMAYMGLKLSMLQTCTLPPALPPTSSIPQGGNKQSTVGNLSAWAPYNVGFSDEMYFAYSGFPEGSNRYIMQAQANFNVSSPEVHTVTQALVLTKKGNSCTIELQPGVTMFEFE